MSNNISSWLFEWMFYDFMYIYISMHIGYNKIGSEGCVALAEALKVNRTINNICLGKISSIIVCYTSSRVNVNILFMSWNYDLRINMSTSGHTTIAIQLS